MPNTTTKMRQKQALNRLELVFGGGFFFYFF
jgi:hypothetical protein